MTPRARSPLVQAAEPPTLRRSRRSRRRAALAVGCTAAVLAVSTGPASARGGVGLGDPLPDVPRSAVTVSLTTVSDQVVAPVAGITAPGIPRELFVVDQVGLLHGIDVSRPQDWPVPARTVLDVSHLVVGPSRKGDERGFLGAAFSPRAGAPRFLYTYTSEATGRGTGAIPMPAPPTACPEPHPDPRPDHQSVIREWPVTVDDKGSVSVNSTRDGRVVLAFDQPQFNHNGGDLDFGPDGMLYVTSGDGGSGDDQDCQTDFDGLPTFGHPGLGNGQNLDTPLGKVLRIDPRPDAPALAPADNPFTGRTGPARPRDLVWAYGLRNPFRASFDGQGRLWLGDVGQNSVEEVDLITKGGNYGWRLREGAFDFHPAQFATHGFASDGFVTAGPRRDPVIDPVAQYDHDDGTAVIGGHVYRGAAMPALRGSYVFGDTSRRIKNRAGRIFHVTVTNPASPHNRVAELLDGPIDGQLIGWGEDTAGELYALVIDRGLTSGRVLRVGQARP